MMSLLSGIRMFSAAVLVLACLPLARRCAQAQSLDGVWEITAVIDNGRVVSPTEIRSELRGRRTGDDQRPGGAVHSADDVPEEAVAVCRRHEPAARRGWIWRVRRRRAAAASCSPSKDSMILCLASRDRDRPTSFASLPGSGNLLITLNRATGDAAEHADAGPAAHVHRRSAPPDARRHLGPSGRGNRSITSRSMPTAT